MKKSDHFYVTTPIYYVTAKPHLGSLYTTLIADVLARWNTLQGHKVFFLTGTDEHGQKIAQAAEKVGMDPKAFVDSFIDDYKKAWNLYELDYDKFIRTTDSYHVKGAQAFVTKLMDNGYIYKSEYKGWYCTPCETFVTDIIEENVPGPLCPTCGRQTHIVSEETYFFKLSAFTDTLLTFYKNNPDFIIPKERFNEVISFVEAGLKDLSISRTTVKWGIPFPADPRHIIYVWVEALCNYITGIGYNQPAETNHMNEWWPADIQILGKDIIRFHAVYWPALLMAADLLPPKQLLVHGWIKVDKQKMSKSFGNVVDPIALQEKYGAEAIRYYLLRQIPVNQDGDFSIADVEMRIESDLANDLGNLLNRVVMLAEKYDAITILSFEVWSQASLDLRDECWNMIEDYTVAMNECMFHIALARVWKFIHNVNAYFHGQEPWKLAKTDRELFLQVLSATCHSLYAIAVVLLPIMPQKMKELLSSIGNNFVHGDNTLEQVELNNWNKQFIVKKIPTLFEKPIKESTENQETSMSAIEKIDEPLQENVITIDDLAKVEIVTGTIEACQEVPGSDKLLQMTVDLGIGGKRTILAGIKKWYTPSELVGKRGLFVANLKPRKMAGIESHGMMLVAEDETGKRQLISAPTSVLNGTRLS